MKYIGRQAPKKSLFDPRLAAAAIFLLLIFLMLYGIGKILFGGGVDAVAPETVQNIIEKESIVDVLNAEMYLRETILQGLSGHQVRGAAQMQITFSEYQVTMAASLPSIDPATERYEAWMLQPGIADYFSVGTFSVRADGWYGLAFKDSLAHVPAEPQTYTRILITRENLREDYIPSNIRIAEGFFNL